MSLSRLWMFLAVFLPVLASVIAPMSTVDLTYHLRAGHEILTTGAIPTVDSWTHTIAGQPWVDQQWGAQVILAITERLGGWTGIVLLRAALNAAIFGSLLIICRRRGVDHRTAALLTIGAFVVAAPAMAMRPQLLGMACFAVVLLLVTNRTAQPRGLWLIPLVVAVWANLHGSFLLGPLAVALAWLEDLHDRFPLHGRTLAVAAASALTACITPFGPWVWAYAVSLSSNPAVIARVAEWQPTSIRDVTGLLYFASVGLVVVGLARRGRPTPWPTLAWLAAFVVIGAYTQRGVAWWPLAAVAAVAGLLVPSVERPRRMEAGLRRMNIVFVTALLLAGVVALPIWRPVEAGTGAPVGVLADAPPGITSALREVVRPGDRILNPQVWGSWFEYALPEATVAVDSRVELVGQDVWQAFDAIQAGSDGWAAHLANWGSTIAVTPANAEGLRRRLVGSGWRVVYADQDGHILVSDQ